MKLTGEGRKYTRADGYVEIYFPSHPDATGHGTVLEHRLVAGKHLGRRLDKDEVVHHKDHNCAHNVWSNLVVMRRKEHDALTLAEEREKTKLLRSRLAEYERRFGAL